MDPFTIIIIVFLVALFAGLSLLPAIYKDSDDESLVQTRHS